MKASPGIVFSPNVLLLQEIVHISCIFKPHYNIVEICGPVIPKKYSKMHYLSMHLDEQNVSCNTVLFQVINYGLGGQYNPHCDFFDVSIFGVCFKLFSKMLFLIFIVMYLKTV